jgi:hypothetical protein
MTRRQDRGQEQRRWRLDACGFQIVDGFPQRRGNILDRYVGHGVAPCNVLAL